MEALVCNIYNLDNDNNNNDITVIGGKSACASDTSPYPQYHGYSSNWGDTMIGWTSSSGCKQLIMC